MEKKKKVFTTQTSLSIRIIVGAYILYNMYQIYTSDSEKSVFIIVMMILLSVVSLALIVFSVKNFIMGEYVGGKADKSQEEEMPEIAETAEDVDFTETAEDANVTETAKDADFTEEIEGV